MPTTGISEFIINDVTQLRAVAGEYWFVEGAGRFTLDNITRMNIFAPQAMTAQVDTYTFAYTSGITAGDVLTAAIDFRSRRDSDYGAGTMQNLYLKPLVFQFTVDTVTAAGIASAFNTALTEVLTNQIDDSNFHISTNTNASNVNTITFDTWYRYTDDIIVNGPGGTDAGVTVAIAASVTGVEGKGLPDLLRERVKSINYGNVDPVGLRSDQQVNPNTRYTQISFDYSYTDTAIGLSVNPNAQTTKMARFSIWVDEDILCDSVTGTCSLTPASGETFALYTNAGTLFALVAAVTGITGVTTTYGGVTSAQLKTAATQGALLQLTV